MATSRKKVTRVSHIDALEHRLPADVLKGLQAHVRRLYPHLRRAIQDGTLRSPYNDKLTPLESYQYGIFQELGALREAFERISHCSVHIRHYPEWKRYKLADGDPYSWLQYHYGYHQLTCTAIGDTAVRLVNKVARLGLSKRHCNRAAVLSNDWIRESRIGTSLRALIDRIEPARESRNLLAHAARGPNLILLFSSDDLDLLQLVGDALVNRHKPHLAGAGLRTLYRTAMAPVAASLESDRDELSGHTKQLLDELWAVYVFHRNSFGPRGSR